MDEPVEYLTEWPPPTPTTSTAIEHEELERKRSRKRECSADVEIRPKKTRRDDLETNQRSVAERELVERPPNIPVSTLLAQWWKSTLRHRQNTASRHTSEPPISSHNPHTLLYHISKKPEAKDFLRARIRYLETLPEDSQCLHSLGSTYHLLQHYPPALDYAKRAVEEDPGNQELLWHLEIVQRQNNILKEQETEMAKLESLEHRVMPKPTEVERRDARDLSYEEFLRQYGLTHIPVVITGMVDKMVSPPWTFDYIKEMIGEKDAPLRRVVPDSVEWARLEPAGSCSVSQFIDTIFTSHTTSLPDLKYLFDWSLPLHCPKLAHGLTIPCYFAGDLLQRTPAGSLYRDSWPSLFVSPANITSDLHIDAFGSNFWMALFQGRKRWTFFPPDDLPLLYPVYHDSTDAVFEVNLSEPDLCRYPLLSLTHPLTVTLSPGELLFVPAGSPHRVENLEPSLAISANFVDPSNLEGVMRELEINGLRDPRAHALLQTLEERKEKGDLTGSVDFEQKDLSWKEFKAWPR